MKHSRWKCRMALDKKFTWGDGAASWEITIPSWAELPHRRVCHQCRHDPTHDMDDMVHKRLSYNHNLKNLICKSFKESLTKSMESFMIHSVIPEDQVLTEPTVLSRFNSFVLRPVRPHLRFACQTTVGEAQVLESNAETFSWNVEM